MAECDTLRRSTDHLLKSSAHSSLAIPFDPEVSHWRKEGNEELPVLYKARRQGVLFPDRIRPVSPLGTTFS